MKILMISVLALSALLQPPQAAAAEATPDWTLLSADKEFVRLSDELERQPVVLFFWATWCPYCKALMPHLQSIRLEYGDNVEILAINFRDDKDPVAFMQSTGYDFTLLLDGDKVAELYKVWGTPGVIVIDRNQRIRFDLRDVPNIELPESVNGNKHSSKAAYIAPYWAAQIRKSLDDILAEQSR